MDRSAASVLGLILSLVPVASVFGENQPARLEALLRPLQSPYAIKISPGAEIADWQKIELRFKPNEGTDPELYYPARQILTQVFTEDKGAEKLVVERLSITLGRHWSYLRMVYHIDVSLVVTGKKSRTFHGGGEFVGRSSKAYLYGDEFKQVLVAEIAKAFATLSLETPQLRQIARGWPGSRNRVPEKFRSSSRSRPVERTNPNFAVGPNRRSD